MRLVAFSMMISASLLTSGCVLMEAGQSVGESVVDIFKPNPGGYSDGDNTGYEDDWSQYGRDARSDRPTTRINDPINKFLTSDKAKAIERSTGVEYE